ncbi:Retrovirus-related Pol polyprotein from transposon opus [Portunus trituberculatus]|uniref:Retrovirus-related Pol polyprotein from transposon opus n=1 Tax=Portunus trituberculatus TaxID=210409 RepID=A0A5B7GL23_PORTR|nr:Retrovirus-related Pol polyprotein from transposon opus [Portunus trituberculatus]
MQKTTALNEKGTVKCDNCKKIESLARYSQCPVRQSQCWSCGKLGHWAVSHCSVWFKKVQKCEEEEATLSWSDKKYLRWLTCQVVISVEGQERTLCLQVDTEHFKGAKVKMTTTKLYGLGRSPLVVGILLATVRVNGRQLRALPAIKGYQQKVVLKAAATPVRHKMGKLPLSVREVSTELQHLAEQGVIECIDAPERIKRVPFGLALEGAAFQKLLNKLLESIPDWQHYLDNIVCTRQTQQEHDERLMLVMKRLWDAQINFCGYRVSRDGIYPHRFHMWSAVDAPPPTNIRDLKRFLVWLFFSFFNLYLVMPVLSAQWGNYRRRTHHLRGHQKWVRFMALKRKISTCLSLMAYNFQLLTIVTTDSSDKEISVVLSQKEDSRKERAIFVLEPPTTTPSEQKYSVTEDALAVVCAVERLKLLLGVDALLRLPVTEDIEEEEEEYETVALLDDKDAITDQEIQESVSTDEEILTLKEYLRQGFPESAKQCPQVIPTYFQFRHEGKAPRTDTSPPGYRATPYCTTSVSPAKMLHGQAMCLELPVFTPCSTDERKLKQRVKRQQERNRRLYNGRYSVRAPTFRARDYVHVRRKGHIPKTPPR